LGVSVRRGRVGMGLSKGEQWRGARVRRVDTRELRLLPNVSQLRKPPQPLEVNTCQQAVDSESSSFART
jgi:hypothetical protein